jgi:hypothetical protein
VVVSGVISLHLSVDYGSEKVSYFSVGRGGLNAMNRRRAGLCFDSQFEILGF